MANHNSANKQNINYMIDTWNLNVIWHDLVWPLLRLLLGMGVGLFLAAFLEYMGWTRILGAFFAPVNRFGHFGPAARAAFPLAFASPMAANGLLSEAWRKGEIDRTELILANICNSFPASLAHLPTLFFLAWPAIGAWSLALVLINVTVAACRTFCALVAGRFLLPANDGGEMVGMRQASVGETGILRLQNAMKKAAGLFLKRLFRLACYTAPCFLAVWLARENGLFDMAKNWLALHLTGEVNFLEPAAIGLVLLQLLAESGASMGAAGALMETGALSGHAIVTALIFGGLLATPLRAIRHQFPTLAGFYSPAMAFWLVLANQGSRAIFMAAALVLYVQI